MPVRVYFLNIVHIQTINLEPALMESCWNRRLPASKRVLLFSVLEFSSDGLILLLKTYQEAV